MIAPARRRALAIFLASSISAGAASAQELAGGGPGGVRAPLSVRDGSVLWQVHREPGDPSRVVASRAGGPSFRARVGAHALVRVAAGRDAVEVLRALDLIAVREVSPTLRAFVVLDAHGRGDGLDLAARLSAQSGPGRPLVDAIPDWILPHRARAITIPPDDPRYPGQWYLDRIAIEDAWRLSSGDASTTILVVDSGCESTHPDLAAHMDMGRDVLDHDDDPSPSPADPGASHGTSCAGLAAAVSDNTEGIAGACPECRLRCVRLLDGTLTDVPISADVEAFQFALDVDADVVSNSWGFVDPTPIPAGLRAIIESVITTGRSGLGALVLFAAGNDDRELQPYEIENVAGVITVGAVNNFDEATAYSNRGEAVDVVAPTGTLTTDLTGAAGEDPTDYTGNFGGTSSACPVAAGVAGLLVSAAPASSGAELADALIQTARPSIFGMPDARGHDVTYGYGRIVPAAALRRALGVPEPQPDAGAPILDAGADGGPPAVSPGGCGCAITTRAPSAWWLLPLVWLWRRSPAR